MTEPERLSRRSTGLAAELLRAGAEEQPSDRGVQRTLLALGVSGVVLSATSTAGAAALGGAQLTQLVSASTAASSVGVTSAATINTVSATLVVKWLSIGALSGFGLAGVASVATRPSLPPPVVVARAAAPGTGERVTRKRFEPPPASLGSSTPESTASLAPPVPRAFVAEPHLPASATTVAAPLALEVSYVDRARTLLASGQANQGLALLEGYEQKFPEARLLPEVLFLQLEANERAGRSSDARRAAQRLVAGFPKSPHAGRARKLLGQ